MLTLVSKNKRQESGGPLFYLGCPLLLHWPSFFLIQ